MRYRWARGLVLPASVVLVAEVAARASHLTSDAVAAPSAVAAAFLGALGDGDIAAATRDTLIAAFAGLAAGGGLGLAFGAAFGLLRPLDRLMELSVESVRPIPSIALIPIALIALGFGYRMEIAIVSFACIWPVLVLTRASIQAVEPRLLEVGRALRLSPLQQLWKIVLPATLPRIVVAFRLTAGVALVVAVTVEIAANPLGLGHAIMTAQQSLQPALMLAYLCWIGLIGLTLNTLMTWAQRRVLGRTAVAAIDR
jgi:NitT/TauT family transport system permease protein